MKTVEGVCDELKGVDGAIGAFVCHRGKCLASSLPKGYDNTRLAQVGSGLSRLTQLSEKAGYHRCSAAFHWQRASLFSWPLGELGVLGLLASPTAARGMLELSASLAVEDLMQILERSPGSNQSPAATVSERPIPLGPPRPAASVPGSPRLEQLEELIVEEVGPTGRALFQRVKRRIIRPGMPESAWLPELRAGVLAELTDPGAWATVATSPLWVP